MRYLQLVQFLQLAIIQFRTEVLVLFGDDQTLPDLITIQHRVNASIPTYILNLFSNSPNTNIELCVQQCPQNQLTIIYFESVNFELIHRIYKNAPNSGTNLLVLVRLMNSAADRSSLGRLFWGFNVVLVELITKPNLQVTVLGKSGSSRNPKFLTTFDGPVEIYRSSYPNALVFRKEFRHWFGAPAVATLSTTILPPFHFLLQVENNEDFLLVSSTMIIFKLIGEIMNFNIHIFFQNREHCKVCHSAFGVYSNNVKNPFLSLRSKLVYEM